MWQFRKLWAGLPANTRGVLWAIVAAIFMSFMAALIKLLGSTLSSFEIAWFRSFFGLLVILPFILRAGGAGTLRSNRLGLHIIRAMIGAVAMMSGFYAVTVLPLALMTSLGFARPLFMVPLAIILLNEVVRGRRWTATIIGFAGVLIAIRPTAEIEPAALIALFSALMVALAMVVTKKLSTTETPVTMMFYQGVLGSFFLMVPIFFVWKTPTINEFLLLALLAIVGTLSAVCMIRSLRAGEATIVAPVEYIRIVFASLIGFFFFMEVPTLWTAAGSVIIIGSTVYIAVREASLGRRRSVPSAEM